jgi:hypothetical protein
MSEDKTLGEALAALARHRSDGGFKKAMRLFGATNVIDAIENCRQFKMYDFTLPELEALSPLICEKMGII